MAPTWSFMATLIMFESGQGVAIMTNVHSQNAMLLQRALANNVAKEYGWRYRTPEVWPGPDTVLLVLAKVKGVPAAIAKYRELKASGATMSAGTLVNLGYAISGPNNDADVIAIMKVAVEEYPGDWNAYDSLAEFYARAGKKQLAIENYTKSVELNPRNRGGIEALTKLKGEN